MADLKVYTIADIRALNPCYDPSRYLPEDWIGTLLDGLRLEAVPARDRIWVAVRFLDDRTNRLFAVACARKALALVEDPDPRCIETCDVAERYANGQATDLELATARAAIEAARDADWDDVQDAAWGAAWGAAGAAAGAATRTAVQAARDAVWAANEVDWAEQIELLIDIISSSED